MDVKLSAKMLAEFVTGTPQKKLSTVRKLRQPRSPDAFIPGGYYKEAIGIIREYHDHNNDYKCITKGIRRLHASAEAATSRQMSTKYLCNLRAVESYIKRFGSKTWRIGSCPRIYFFLEDVRISGNPDFAIQDSGRLQLFKLGIRKKRETQEMIRLMLRAIFKAAKTKMTKFAPDDTGYFDVATGDIVRGEVADSSLDSSIQGACKTLQQMMSAN